MKKTTTPPGPVANAPKAASPKTPARPRIPRPAGAPLVARVAQVATLLLAAYAFLWALTFLDVERRLLAALLTGGALPVWALGGGIAGLAGSILTLRVARLIYTDARRIADQDARLTRRVIPVLVIVAVLHAIILGGPLARWISAAPPAGYLFFGDPALLLAPVAVLVAALALVARNRAQAWLSALPE